MRVIDNETALLYTAAVAGVIFFCRALPFVLKTRPPAFIEKTVPPAAMAVLAFNSLSAQTAAARSVRDIVPAFCAALLCVLLHLIKRNALISIFASTALYMILTRFL